MIHFDRFILKNGLTVLVLNDKTTPIVAINILYNVGAKDENPELTGFAHLFEHLMFGGSKNIKKYDVPLEKVGGENNAFTNNDITNYYLTLPKNNIETGFWLESDRMLDLAFSKKSLDVQRNVVIEEYKQRYLNQPYGDVFLHLRPLAYQVHPYKWATIGKDISHIEKAQMGDVKEFYHKFYNPSNAIMVVAGDVSTDYIKELAKKWFEPIPSGEKYVRNLPIEPKQTLARKLKLERDVPSNAIYKAYHIPARLTKEYYCFDLLSDLLSNGKSSRLYQTLVMKNPLFTSINAYISGSADPGLFIISGMLGNETTIEMAENAIQKEIEKLFTEINEIELKKVKTKIESEIILGEINLLDRAMSIAHFEWLGDAQMHNLESSKYNELTISDLQIAAKEYLTEENSSTIYYIKNNS